MNELNNSLPEIDKVPSYNDLMKSMDAISNDYLKSNAVQNSQLYERPITEVNKNVDRILQSGYGYNPYLDNEDYIAQNTGTLTKLAKGVGKLVLTTGTKVGSSVGFLGSLVPYAMVKAVDTDSNFISNVADNAFSKAFDSLETDIKESSLFGTFQEAVDRDKGFWKRATSDIDFWTDDVVDGIAFMASAWVPGLALSKVNLGEKAIKAFANITGKVGQLDDTIINTGKAYKIYNNAKKYGEYIDQFNSWGLASASEAMFEAKGIQDNILEKLKDDTTISEEEKKRIAAENAKNGFVMNLALLGITNIFEAKLVHKFTKGTTGKVENLVGGNTFLDDLVVKPGATSKIGKFLEGKIAKTAYTIGKGTFREGYIEENAQLAIQRLYEREGEAKQVGSLFGLKNYKDLGSQLLDQTVKSFTENTQEAKETSLSIGIGGIIGGMSNIYVDYKQGKQDKLTTENAIKLYNKTKENFLKFGNVYKTETIEVADVSGNKIKKEVFVKDENGQFVEDDEKIKTVLGQNFKLEAQLDIADKTANAETRQRLKDEAFGDFVLAHIHADMGEAVIEKLNKLSTATTEDLAKLGFVPNSKSGEEIARYKNIASLILKQNEIIENSLTLKNTEEDRARKSKLIDLGKRQVIDRFSLTELERKNNDLGKSIFEGSKATTNSLVDQLNTLVLRIQSYENSIKKITELSPNQKSTIKNLKDLLKNLKDEENKLKKDNELSLQKLTQSEDGFYDYEEPSINFNPALKNYTINLITAAGYKNNIDVYGREWASYADEINGREVFKEGFIKEQIVEPVNKAAEKEEKEKEEATKIVAKETAIDLYFQLKSGKDIKLFTPEEQIILNDPKIITQEVIDEVEKKLNPKPLLQPGGEKLTTVPLYKEGDQFTSQGETYTINSISKEDDEMYVTDLNGNYNQFSIKDFEEAVLNNIVTLLNVQPPPVIIVIPTVDVYLKGIYDELSKKGDFKLTYNEWMDKGDADPYITEYNTKYSKNEKLRKKINTPQKTELEKTQEEIEKANFKKLKVNKINEIVNLISKWVNIIGANNKFIDLIESKIDEIEDDFVKTSIKKLVYNKDIIDNTYTDPVEKGAKVNRWDINKGDGIIEISKVEMFNGFSIRGKKEFISQIASAPGTLSQKMKVIVSRKLVEQYAKEAADLGIENRTAITFETKDEINTKLKKGKSVIAFGNKVTGFNTQFFVKEISENPENLYLQSIDTYYIVHPDNTTEPVVFSEAQKDFVKENMRFDGKRLTDEQFDKLQNIFNKLQKFNAEVETLLLNNDSLDITPIFQRYFDISSSGIIATKGDSMETVIKNNPENLFEITVATINEDGTESFEKRLVPLFAYKKGSTWIKDFSLNSNERVVNVTEELNGEVLQYDEIFNLDEFLQNNFGVRVELNDKFPSNNAWIAKTKDTTNNSFPHALKQLKGTEPIKMFKDFRKSLNNLRDAIIEGDKTGEYTFEGVKYPTLNQMLINYNKKHYGFFKASGWYVDISYESKSGKFVLELRPEEFLNNKKQWNADNADIKNKLNLFLNPIPEIADDATDENVLEIYNTWVSKTMDDFSNLIKKNQNSKDERLQSLGNKMSLRTLFFYENEMDNVRNWRFKMVDKSLSSTMAPNLVFDNPKKKNIQINVALKDEIPAKSTKIVVRATLGEVNEISQEELDKLSGKVPVSDIETKKADIENLNTQIIYKLNIRRNDKTVKKAINDSNKGLITIEELDKVFKKWNDENGLTVLMDKIDTLKEELNTLTQTNPTNTTPKGRKKPVAKKDNDVGFKLKDNEDFEKYTEESFSEEAKWLAKALKGSGIEIKDLGSIVHNLITKKQILGFYYDLAVYVDKASSARGTIYHEAFHGLFRNVFTPIEREFYLAKAKEKLGKISQKEINEFRYDRNYTTKTDAEIENLIAEEYLAEGFRKYKLSGKTPKEGFLAKFVKIIERIINFFKGNKNEIENLYKNFDESGFAHRNSITDINKEGAYSLVYGRPRLELVDNDYQYDDKIPMNLEVYNDIVNRLAYEVANNSTGDFSEKFDSAVEKLKQEYDIEKLVLNAASPENASAIRNKYETYFLEASYALGKQVPYILDDSLITDDEAIGLLTEEDLGKQTFSEIKEEVRNVIKTLGLTAGFNSENLEMKQSDEDIVETEKGGDFDTVHLNPLTGISSEFRSLFSLIPYNYVDPELGVTIKKTADGAMLFNAMLKVSSNSAADKIIPNLIAAVTSMQEDNDQTYAPLEAFVNFLGTNFGIVDIMNNPSALPTKNHFLYNQLIDTFFATELDSNQIVHEIQNGIPNAFIKEASISEDMTNKYNTIKHLYEKNQRTLLTNDDKEQFNKNFENLKTFVKQNIVMQGDKDPLIKVKNREALNKLTKELKNLFDGIKLHFPQHLIRQSLLAIYSLERDGVISPQSVKSFNDLEVNSALFKEEAYLHSKFFDFISQITVENYSNLFADTKDKTVNVGKQREQIDGINKIIKNSAKFIIKYDINSAISVYQNAENKKIWRYTRYTPPVLIAQAVREQGPQILGEFYPALQSYFEDNPLFDNSPENALFLENFNISMFGGFRQKLDGESRQGVTFGSIDSKTLMLSNIINFINRKTITKTMLNKQGKKEKTTITVFNRSRSQEEATTTNYLVTGKYEKYTDLNGDVNQKFIDLMSKMLRQEYNRISREWATRNDENITRYKNYNELVEGDNDFIVVNGKQIKQRAYQFRVFEHFFSYLGATNQSVENLNNLQTRLKTAAKNNELFEDIFNEELSSLFSTEMKTYMKSDFKTYFDALESNGLIKKSFDTVEIDGSIQEIEKTTSNLIPDKIKLDLNSETIDKFGYSGLEDLLLDQHLNIVVAKMLANQIFDGDIATGIKSQTEYFKRNKSSVISGNSMKVGQFTASVVEQLEINVNDNNLLEGTSDEEFSNSTKVAAADGQAYNKISHVIKMFKTWGRADNEVLELLNESKFRALTVNEVIKLENKKVILNSKKTAVGGIFEYYKMSEHLIMRTDVSYLDTKGMSKAETYRVLRNLYNEVDILEEQLYEDLNGPESENFRDQIQTIYNEIHSYWKPKRSRETLHFLLNSMEISATDMVFDPNASKKTTIVPVKLNKNGITNLRASQMNTKSMFKFMQVETAGMHDRITDPSQARQLLTTYLDKIKNDITYSGKTLQELSQEYSEILGGITRASTAELDKLMTNEDGSLNLGLIFKAIQRGLKKQGADSNTLKFFDLKDGVPVHNPNLPIIKKQFTYYYFSLFNDAIFSRNVAGRADIHVSSYGYNILYDVDTNKIITDEEYTKNPELFANSNKFKTRHLGITTEVKNGKTVYYVECILPKHLSNNPLEQKLFLEKLNMYFGTRIPTEDKRSMVVLKVVDYLDHAYRNSIIVPQAVHILAGSDLDVDKLYSQGFDYYTDFNGVPHVYGDYSGYKTESQGRFIEYMEYMSKSPSLRDIIELELEKIEGDVIIPDEFIALADELNIAVEDIPTQEELKDQRKNLQNEIERIEKEKLRLKEIHDIEFEKYINNKKDKQQKKTFEESRLDYIDTRVALNEKEDELDALKSYQAQIKRTLKLIATYNVLKNRKYPTSQSALTSFIKKNNYSPVVAAMDNKLLQIKIDILSNKEVFKNFYINERSEVQSFKNVANSIGASVEDVTKITSIYSIMGDVIANDLNSSSKDSLGNTAAFNKFLSFAQKTKLEIPTIFLTRETSENINKNGDLVTERKNKQHYHFQSDGAIPKVGKAIGMFADAAKDPIPAVLNLNPDTAFASNIMVALGIDLQHSLLINKIPLFEKAIKLIQQSNTNVKDSNGDKKLSIKRVFKDIRKDVLELIKEENLLGATFERNEDGEIDFASPIPVYLIKNEPNKDFLKKNENERTLLDLGISFEYENGDPVNDLVAMYNLISSYINMNTVNGDIIKLTRILNLIKNQDPDFTKLDTILFDVNYFLDGESVFGDSIINVLKSHPEYAPLITAAQKMSDYSKEVFIDRTTLFKNINKNIQNTFNIFTLKDSDKEKLNNQITQYIIANKVKIDIKNRIKELQNLTELTDNQKGELNTLKNSIKYFEADYWINNNTIVEDLDYLYDNHKGNAFVTFLKTTTRRKIDYLEVASRIKLDKELSRNILQGYESLQKSKDEKTLMLSRQMFYYLVAKDGLGYGTNTFLGYISADFGVGSYKMASFKAVSDMLEDFHNILLEQEKSTKKSQKEINKLVNSNVDQKIKEKEIKKILDKDYEAYEKRLNEFFSVKAGTEDHIETMLRKIYSFADNQKYVRIHNILKTSNFEKNVKEKVAEILNKNVFSNQENLGKNEKVPSNIDWFQGNKDITINFNNVLDIIPEDIESITKFKTVVNLETNKIVGIEFPRLLRNGDASNDGNVFILTELDGQPITGKDIFTAILHPYMSKNISTGFTAKYTILKPQGVKGLLNFAMNNDDAIAIYEHTKRDNEENQQSMPPDFSQNEIEYQEIIGANTLSHNNDDIEEKDGVYVIDDPSFWEEMNNGGLQENLVLPTSFESTNEVIEIEDNNLWEELEREKQERLQQLTNIPDDSITDSRGKSQQEITKYPQITNFYNSLTAEQKKKINSLNELIRDYNQIPFDYTEEDFIKDLKCKL